MRPAASGVASIVSAPVDGVLEDVPGEREDHRRVLGRADRVLVRPGGGLDPRERPLRAFDEAAKIV